MPAQAGRGLELEFRLRSTRIQIDTHPSPKTIRHDGVTIERSSRNVDFAHFDIIVPGCSFSLSVSETGAVAWEDEGITLKRRGNTLIICYTHPED